MEVIMSNWQIFLDVFMLAAIALIVFFSVKRGFVKSFFGTAKPVIVIVITVIIGAMLVGICEERIVSEKLEGRVTDILIEKAEQSGGELSFDDLTEDLPTIVKKAISLTVAEQYFNSIGGSGVEVAKKLGSKIEGLAIDVLSNALAAFIGFIIAYVACTLAVYALDRFFRLPILNDFNKFCGLIWGISSAYIFVSIAVLAVAIICGRDYIADTFITGLIYKIGLFTH
jgi:hypothetical protein